MADLNKFDIAVSKFAGGYRAYIRFPKDGGLKPVLVKGGRPAHYASEAEAYREATRRLLGYINGKLRSSGITGSNPKAEAEALFKK